MGKRKKDESDGDYDSAGGDDDDDDDDYGSDGAFVPESSGGAGGDDDDDDDEVMELKSEDEADKEPAKKKQKTSKTTAKKGGDSEEKKPAAKKKAAATKKGGGMYMCTKKIKKFCTCLWSLTQRTNFVVFVFFVFLNRITFITIDKAEKTEKATTSKAKKADAGSGSKAAAGGKKDVKPKVAVIKSEPEARKVIYDYLQSNNRPYSIQNIIDNLHGRVKKAITQKALDSLVASNKITLKEQGKTKKVYMLNQDGLEVLQPEELGALDREIAGLKQEKAALLEEIKELTANKEKASKQLSNEELDEAIAKLTTEVAEQRKDIARLDSVTLATPEEKKQALANLEKYLKEWRIRKRKTMDIASYLSEVKSMKIKEILEEVGIETDEDAKVNINDMGKQQ